MEGKICVICGSEFFKRQNESVKEWSGHKYCKKECFHKSIRGIKKTEEECLRRRKNVYEKTCKQCGKTFSNQVVTQQYCGRDCYKLSVTGVSKKGHTAWNKGLKGFKHSEKSKQRMSESKSGRKSHLWKGGITKLSFAIRNSKKYREWKIEIFKRDQFKCLDCGDCKGGNLVAHHIKWFSTIMNDNSIKTYDEAIKCAELWDINNGVTVCNKCHEKRHPELKFIGKGGHKNSKAIKLVA